MDQIPCFNASSLEAACKVLADTTTGLSGSEIGHILADMQLPDPDASGTKWKRLFNALAFAQNRHQVGNHLIMFITRALSPVRYVSHADLFSTRRDNLNVVLSFSGFVVREDGKVARTNAEATLRGAKARAGRLRQVLEARGTHDEVLKYARSELLQDNYFHAVLEAIKGIAERIRVMSGLSGDGAELVTQALSTKAPILALNTLKSDTEISEQKGITNMIVGLFGAVRNPAAHAPKITWAMQEQDAIDILGLVSFVHRKLDGAVRSNSAVG
jgi:uncharacterized protein (TIGR02391 family)